MAVQVAVVQNTSGSPITMTDLTFEVSRGTHMRTETMLGSTSQTEDLFPGQVLLPDERLLIPIQILFAGEDSVGPDLDAPIPVSRATRLELARSVEPAQEYSIGPFMSPGGSGATSAGSSGSSDQSILTLPGQRLKELLVGNPAQPQGRVFYYGHGVRLLTCLVDGEMQQLRPFDPEYLVVCQGLMVGSCPFVVTGERDGVASYVARVLTGREGPGKEGYYRVLLPRVSDWLEIRELEREISYIKRIRITRLQPDREKRDLRWPSEEVPLPRPHGLVLRGGESKVFALSGSQAGGSSPALLEIWGYYEPETREGSVDNEPHSPAIPLPLYFGD
jgi:hypothetical protein